MKQTLSLFILWCVLVPGMTQAAALNEDAQILHLLNRTSYGPVPGDIAAVRQMGIDNYIEQQLHPERMDLPAGLQSRLESLPTVNAKMADLAEHYQPPARRIEKLSQDWRTLLKS